MADGSEPVRRQIVNRESTTTNQHALWGTLVGGREEEKRERKQEQEKRKKEKKEKAKLKHRGRRTADQNTPFRRRQEQERSNGKEELMLHAIHI